MHKLPAEQALNTTAVVDDQQQESSLLRTLTNLRGRSRREQFLIEVYHIFGEEVASEVDDEYTIAQDSGLVDPALTEQECYRLWKRQQ